MVVHHKEVEGSECISPSILCLDGRRCWVDSLTLRPASPSDTHRKRTRWNVQKKNLLLLPESTPDSSVVQAITVGCSDYLPLERSTTKVCVSALGCWAIRVGSTFHCQSCICE